MSIEINIDSTSLGSSGCILNFKRTTFGELVDSKLDPLGAYKSTSSSSMIYGVAVHKFIDTMYKTGGNFPIARDEALKCFHVKKTPPSERSSWLADHKHLISTCYNTWNEYVEKESSYDVLMLGDKPATEITFRIPFFEDEYVKIYLCGTIDTIGKFKNGCFAIRDWKTTSSYNKEDYMSSYRLSRQLRIYTLACKLEAASHPDSVLGRIGNTKMGAFIDGIFLKAKANDTEYMRGEVYQFSDDDLNATKLMIINFCQDLSLHVKHNHWPKQGILNGSCVGLYGRCRFWNVCASNDAVGNMLLARDFTRKYYDPLNFND